MNLQERHRGHQVRVLEPLSLPQSRRWRKMNLVRPVEDNKGLGLCLQERHWGHQVRVHEVSSVHHSHRWMKVNLQERHRGHQVRVLELSSVHHSHRWRKVNLVKPVEDNKASKKDTGDTR